MNRPFDELADLLELIFAIAARRGYGLRELMNVRADKAVTRGAFDLVVFRMETD